MTPGEPSDRSEQGTPGYFLTGNTDRDRPPIDRWKFANPRKVLRVIEIVGFNQESKLLNGLESR
jgi:hypothetical protein